MSKTRPCIKILLMLLLIIFININFANSNNTKFESINNSIVTYKCRSDYIDTVVYNPKGALNYRFIAQQVEYFSNEKVSWFTKPMITTFDTNKMPTWLIKSDKAKLTNDFMLYLYGHVKINALTIGTQLRKIIADNVKINLINQDVTSQDLVMLYGKTFNSSGLGMHGNLNNKNAKLIENVRTLFQIQNKQKKP